MKRVVVGLSGGVDSSVAAHLLIEQGYEVIALFMRNWVDDSVIISDECPWIDDSNDALEVAEMLGIPFQVIDFSKEYKERIVDYMFDEYAAGRTPNPDVLCNREVKFDIFLDKALSLGADYVATGHYCQKETMDVDGKKVHRLIAGADRGKDQSYFLCQLNQEQLSKALFPIGHLQKSEVRKIAKEIGLNTAEKKDSQGLCFIGKVKLPEFLQQQLKPKQGDIIEVPDNLPEFTYSSESLNELTKEFVLKREMGEVVGTHQGAHYFTIGQRKGLNVGGKPLPLFVVKTDTKENIVYVGQGDEHQALNRKGLFIKNEDIHWVREDMTMKDGEMVSYMGRIRYRQPLSPFTLYKEPEGLYVIFDEKQRGVTPGQFAAWYQNGELIGSGVIA
ncbi:tRNA 2-thiouridine(34) synthase MnmA [Parvicella tangerina]|uniref:tRNA-specific 2-thiouridylase MnmA n=1 Tax=Parvicella tangerina TaxID=2829795 RepID=A0A916JRR9_9FLAO|nr:tRNA 2-thiouridine(34) synthase MnmA [Parvicella tangerina]CAG5087817.1 tRNA-specific 2-thiouridylase MnmA [Parvicella tangerina]